MWNNNFRIQVGQFTAALKRDRFFKSAIRGQFQILPE